MIEATRSAITTAPTEVRLRRVHRAALSPAEWRAIVERSATTSLEVRERVRAIVEQVRTGGDSALRQLNQRLGGGLPAPEGGQAPLSIDRSDLLRGRDAMPRALRRGLEQMSRNIERFHAVQVPHQEQWVDVAPGIRVGRAWRPLRRVAAYVPGGSATYPSSLLMSAIPARLAGVHEFVVASPAGAEGTVSPALLGAAGLMEVDELLVMGGAQAIAALAHGTESIRPVDKIVGPGNAWVTAAKLEVLGVCAIDMPAGPSEVMVVADETADPRHVAADLLSQAEHGPDSPAILVTPSVVLADAVDAEVARQVGALSRQAELLASLRSAGIVVMTASLDEAIQLANDYAPEHLSVVVADDSAIEDRIHNAGSLFVGPFAPESAGDYATGSNHVLPTGRLARAYGALGVESFGHWLQLQRVTREGLASIHETIAVVAEAEGLTAHRRAVDIRFEQGASDG